MSTTIACAVCGAAMPADAAFCPACGQAAGAPAQPDTLETLSFALKDRYRVERVLGRGGMATVFLAHDLRHERDVAIKVLHPELAASMGAERFEREIKVAARLHHPHILSLYDSGTAGSLCFYVMPFVQGESLRNRLDREQMLPVEDALTITLEKTVLPQPLFAARYFGTGGLSGSVRTFRPFGGVDPVGIMTPNDDFTRGPNFGALVEIVPAVTLTTPTGRPLQGFAVSWVVTSGGGSVGNPLIATDANGFASAGSWRFGFVNPQTLTATAAAPAGISFVGSPFVFNGIGHQDKVGEWESGRVLSHSPTLPLSYSPTHSH